MQDKGIIIYRDVIYSSKGFYFHFSILSTRFAYTSHVLVIRTTNVYLYVCTLYVYFSVTSLSVYDRPDRYRYDE